MCDLECFSVYIYKYLHEMKMKRNTTNIERVRNEKSKKNLNDINRKIANH